MKPLAKLMISGILVLFVVGGGVLGLVITNAMSGGDSVDDGPAPEQATPENDEPTPTGDPVETCLNPTPAAGDGPGATEVSIDDRAITSDAIETQFSESVYPPNPNTGERTTIDTNLSVLARQHAEATAGGNTYDYSVSNDCTLNTVHTDVLTDDVGYPSAGVVANALETKFSDSELDSIQADHDAVGVGAYLDNGEIHITVATLDTSN